MVVEVRKRPSFVRVNFQSIFFEIDLHKVSLTSSFIPAKSARNAQNYYKNGPMKYKPPPSSFLRVLCSICSLELWDLCEIHEVNHLFREIHKI